MSRASICSRSPRVSGHPDEETSVLQVKLSHNHFAAISGMARDGRLLMQVREDLCGAY